MEKCKEDWFAVVRQGEDVIPVFLVIAQDRREAKLWAHRLICEIEERAKNAKEVLPFSPREAGILDLGEFYEAIGLEASCSSGFQTWYTYSRLNFLRFQLHYEMQQAAPALHSEAGVVRAWRDLEEMISNFLVMANEPEKHSPGEMCFTCGMLTGCMIGQQYMLENSDPSGRSIN